MENKGFLKYLCFIVTAFIVVSCATTKDIKVRKKVRPLSDNKLFMHVVDSSLDYSALYFKKFSVSVNNNGKKNTYKGLMKIQRDSAIWISMTAPLGIEVARILITRDSVKLIDRYHKEYFVGDFNLIASKFNNDFDFFTIQSILTNSLFEFPKYDDKPFVRNFKSKVINDQYVFYTFNERKIEKKYRRVERKNKRQKESPIVYQANYIDPDSFRIVEVLIDELSKDWRFNIKYKNFKRVEGKLFPMDINFWVEAEAKRFSCKVQLSKLDFRERVKLSFKIPSSYKKIK